MRGRAFKPRHNGMLAMALGLGLARRGRIVQWSARCGVFGESSASAMKMCTVRVHCPRPLVRLLFRFAVARPPRIAVTVFL